MEELPRKIGRNDGEDRISKLPDELLHHILSFVYSNEAVQTCILSKRWVNLWSTLPVLEFVPNHLGHRNYNFRKFDKFVNDFFKYRDQQSNTCSIKINFGSITKSIFKPIFDYASTHHIEQFTITNAIVDYPLSFPNLRNLSLRFCKVNLVDWSLPSLQDLCCVFGFGTLHGSKMPLSFPLLRNLHLLHCMVRPSTWRFPSLTTLYLENVTLLGSKTQLIFEGFPNLKKLTLIDCPELSKVEVVTIDSPNLTSFTISQELIEQPPTCTFMVLAPNLSSFEFQGKCVPKLCTVDGFPLLNQVKLDIHIHINKYERKEYNSEEKKKQVIQNLITLFHEFQRTKFLTLSSATTEVLSRLPKYLEDQPSPFDNLESLTLLDSRLQPARLTNFSEHVIRYFLSNSPCIEIFIKGRSRCEDLNTGTERAKNRDAKITEGS